MGEASNWKDLLGKLLVLYLTAFRCVAVFVLALTQSIFLILLFLISGMTGAVMRLAQYVDAWQPVIPGVFRWQ